MSNKFTFHKHDSAGFAPYSNGNKTALYDLLKRGLTVGGLPMNCSASKGTRTITVTTIDPHTYYIGQVLHFTETGNTELESLELTVVGVQDANTFILVCPSTLSMSPVTGKIASVSLGWQVHTDDGTLFIVKRSDPNDDLRYVFDRSDEALTTNVQTQAVLKYYVAREVEGVLTQISQTVYATPRVNPKTAYNMSGSDGDWMLVGDKDTFYLINHPSFDGSANASNLVPRPWDYRGFTLWLAGGLLDAPDKSQPADLKSFYIGFPAHTFTTSNSSGYTQYLPFPFYRDSDLPSGVSLVNMTRGGFAVRNAGAYSKPIGAVIPTNANVRGPQSSLGYAAPPTYKLPVTTDATYLGFLRGFVYTPSDMLSVFTNLFGANAFADSGAPTGNYFNPVYVGEDAGALMVGIFTTINNATGTFAYPLIQVGIEIDV